MNLLGHRFSQNANQKLQGFLPYQTNKDRSQKNCLQSPKNHQRKVLRSLFQAMSDLGYILMYLKLLRICSSIVLNVNLGVEIIAKKFFKIGIHTVFRLHFGLIKTNFPGKSTCIGDSIYQYSRLLFQSCFDTRNFETKIIIIINVVNKLEKFRFGTYFIEKGFQFLNFVYFQVRFSQIDQV